jgi:hypothetical protein
MAKISKISAKAAMARKTMANGEGSMAKMAKSNGVSVWQWHGSIKSVQQYQRNNSNNGNNETENNRNENRNEK